MPRILVADDNSNIQKMVALALKDVGIDVVAVPNGEAAVRKLTDTGLDLVLADIFMPVRSGYEVCDYIKHDTRYSHLPVILLVGAFDPLDEREAQRVGADGILKKPFVPPDPLINMVKNLLAKSAGDRLVAVAAPVAASVAAVAEAPAAEAVPALPSPRFAKATLPDFPTTDFADAPPDEFVPPVSRLDFSDHEQPVAFGALLDAPATDESDLTVTASRDPVLGEPAFWASPTAPDAVSEEDGTPAEEAIQDHSWGHHAQPLPFGTDSAALPSVKHQPELSNASAEAEAGVAFGISPGIIEKISANTNGNGNEGGHLAGLEAPPAFAPPTFEPEVGRAGEDQSESDDAGRNNVLKMSSVAAIEPTAMPELSSLSEIFAAPVIPADESSGLSKIFELPKTDELAAREIDAQPLTETTMETKPATKVETETEAAIEPELDDTQELEIPESGVHPWNVEPVDPEPVVADSIAEEVAHTAPRPNIDEMPAWMATASTIFPPVEDSLERLAARETASPSEAEPATHETFEYSARAGSEEPSVNDAHSADAAPTTEWPPAFEPKVSDAAVFERPAAMTSAQMSDLSGALGPIATSAVEGAQMPNGAKQSPEVMEAAINRIVERMQPQVMDVVTREILRPLVEALVRRELGKQ